MYLRAIAIFKQHVQHPLRLTNCSTFVLLLIFLYFVFYFVCSQVLNHVMIAVKIPHRLMFTNKSGQ